MYHLLHGKVQGLMLTQCLPGGTLPIRGTKSMVLPARNETKVGSLGLSWRRLAARCHELMSLGKEGFSIITFVEHENIRMDASYSLQELEVLVNMMEFMRDLACDVQMWMAVFAFKGRLAVTRCRRWFHRHFQKQPPACRTAYGVWVSTKNSPGAWSLFSMWNMWAS